MKPGIQYLIHFISENKLIAKKQSCLVPRVGDEIRLSVSKVYFVNRVVWVYDEEEHYLNRVNIEIQEN